MALKSRSKILNMMSAIEGWRVLRVVGEGPFTLEEVPIVGWALVVTEISHDDGKTWEEDDKFGSSRHVDAMTVWTHDLIVELADEDDCIIGYLKPGEELKEEEWAEERAHRIKIIRDRASKKPPPKAEVKS